MLKGRNVTRVFRELRDAGMFKMIVDKNNISLEKMLTANTSLSVCPLASKTM